MTLTETERRALIDLAKLTAEVIRRMGAAYGPINEWRRDFAMAVHITQTFVENKAVEDDLTPEQQRIMRVADEDQWDR